MSEKNTGGPAFPVVVKPDQYSTGMTLRDYFAAKALHGLLANGTLEGGAYFLQETHGETMSDEFAIISYRMADAMLKAREE